MLPPFESIPLWGISVFVLYAMRRVNCPVAASRATKCPGTNAAALYPTRTDGFWTSGPIGAVGGIDAMLDRRARGTTSGQWRGHQATTSFPADRPASYFFFASSAAFAFFFGVRTTVTLVPCGGIRSVNASKSRLSLDDEL